MSKAETIRSGTLGKKTLRLVRKDGRFFGLADGKVCVEGDNADDVWRQLHDDAGKSDPKYFGFDGARGRFLKFFPNGFHSEGYASQERDYKLSAKAKLDETAPLDKATDGKGFGEAVLAVFRATNMLSPFEKTRLQDVLRGHALMISFGRRPVSPSTAARPISSAWSRRSSRTTTQNGPSPHICPTSGSPKRTCS